SGRIRKEKAMNRSRKMRATFSLAVAALLVAATASAFCGFYVAKADTRLFNRASQVALVRDGDRTVLTMSNDFKGELKEFAIVIPVPTCLARGTLRAGARPLLDPLAASSAPRLVESFDDAPCRRYDGMPMAVPAPPAAGMARQETRAKSLGVKIEASY